MGFSLLENIIYRNTYSCIEVTQLNDGLVLNNLVTQVIHSDLSIVGAETYTSIDDKLITNAKGKAHHLIVNNEEVIYKTVTKNQYDLNKIVQEVYPSVRSEDFYYQYFIADEDVHLFICQKAYIDECIVDFEKHNIHITQLSLGCSCIETIIPYLKLSQSLNFNNYKILNPGKHLEIIPSSAHSYEEYYLEGLTLSSSNILLFSGALTLYTGKENQTISNFDVLENKQLQNFKQNRLFNLALPISVGFLFVIAVLNTFYYTHYFDKVQHLIQLSEINKSQREAIIEQDSIVNKKQKLFEDVIHSTSSRSSFFINQIAKTKPTSINLSAIIYQPIQKRIRTDKIIEIFKNNIVVSGTLSEINELTGWIRLLEKEKFIKNISIESVSNQSRQSSFILNIDLNED
ncbi:hypothetical protein [Dokdonia sp. Hel_I_53]|uniref:hypothetical protein n=1 Tax=Dokdonia sp. Hel_I_53 TaxID=1566287 RepID=UPI00119B512A|nr:hypothetical protein [Dokdonia sp. Hel_I_53]TVZ52269.1 hypothetical protein OD90_1439 [Dokdonia sp. Hel_I_53]